MALNSGQIKGLLKMLDNKNPNLTYSEIFDTFSKSLRSSNIRFPQKCLFNNSTTSGVAHFRELTLYELIPGVVHNHFNVASYCP